jgi:hypothetical protein
VTEHGRRRGAADHRGGAGDVVCSPAQREPMEESGMDGQRITGRFGRRLLWCTLGAMLALGPGTASAVGTSTDACTQADIQIDSSYTCQNQTQTTITYSGLQSQGWAYYCTGDHPYFPGSNSPPAIAWNNTCFTEVENEFLESGSKEDGSFTNWCTSIQSLTVVLACYNKAFPAD